MQALRNDLVKLLDQALLDVQSAVVDFDVQSFEQYALSLKLQNSELQLMFQLVLSYAMKAEHLSPGSMSKFIRALSKSLKNSDDGNLTVEKLLSQTVTSFRGTWQNVIQHIDKTVTSSKIASIIKSAVELAGLHGKIFVERSANTFSSIELTNGFTFDVNTTTVKNNVLLDTKIIVIEGYVENVSELTLLFTQLAETKERCAVFARAFSNDVYQTVQMNNTRGAFDVSLFMVPFELEGINMLNDIAVASNAQLVSPNLGNLITTTTLEKAGYFSKILIRPNSITAQNSSTSLNVRNHVLNLIEKSEANDVEDVKDLLNKRIKSLTSTAVVIRLPDDKLYLQDAFTIDKSLRAIKTIMNYGVQNDGILIVDFLIDRMVLECQKMLMNIGAIIIQAV